MKPSLKALVILGMAVVGANAIVLEFYQCRKNFTYIALLALISDFIGGGDAYVGDTECEPGTECSTPPRCIPFIKHILSIYSLSRLLLQPVLVSNGVHFTPNFYRAEVRGLSITR
jgi:hypothetical protein